MEIAAPVLAVEVGVDAGRRYSQPLPEGYAANIVVIAGSGQIVGEAAAPRDFFVVTNTGDLPELEIQSEDGDALRLMLVIVPLDPGYPLRA